MGTHWHVGNPFDHNHSRASFWKTVRAEGLCTRHATCETERWCFWSEMTDWSWLGLPCILNTFERMGVSETRYSIPPKPVVPLSISTHSYPYPYNAYTQSLFSWNSWLLPTPQILLGDFSLLICRGEISDPSKVVYYLPMGWSNHDFIGKFIAIVAIKLLLVTYIYHYLPIIGGDPGQNTTPLPQRPGLAADSSPTATAWTVAVRECEHHHGVD